MPGPPPKPTALRILQGNPGKRRLNHDEPKPVAKCVPPAWLPALVLVEWKRQAPALEKLGLLTELDGEAFATLCTLSVALQLEANDEQPSVSKLLYLSKELRGLWSRFGMTPADRSRVKVEKDKPASKLSGFVRGA
jgi:phage terminase small subunit